MQSRFCGRADGPSRVGGRVPLTRRPGGPSPSDWRPRPNHSQDPSPVLTRPRRSGPRRDPRSTPDPDPIRTSGRREQEVVGLIRDLTAWLIPGRVPADSGAPPDESRRIVGSNHCGRDRLRSSPQAGRADRLRGRNRSRRGHPDVSEGLIGCGLSPINPAPGGDGGRWSSPDPRCEEGPVVVESSWRETEVAW